MIVLLTGAGISKESGLATFREKEGLWENERVEDVATPEGFKRNPLKVFQFYQGLYSYLCSGQVQPNAAHYALANLEEALKEQVFLVTQNVDDLHERAGSKNVVHMHGELKKVRCSYCNTVTANRGLLNFEQTCSYCGKKGDLRPHIVWFGERPLCMNEIEEALRQCRIFAAIGTSGQVYPAAGFAAFAKSQGAHLIEFNLEKTDGSYLFDTCCYGPASQTLPKWVASIIGQ